MYKISIFFKFFIDFKILLCYNVEKYKERNGINMKKRIGKVGEVSWIIGNILCAIGNCLAAKSGLGVATIVAPAFVLNRALTPISSIFSVGVCEYIIQGILLAVCCLLIRRFKPKFIFTICNIIFYGTCFDIVNSLFSFISADSLLDQILLAAIGTVITGLAVAIMLRTYIPPSSYEIFVKEVALAKKIDMSKMKLIFDGTLLVIAVVLMLTTLGGWKWDIIGPLTLITAFLNSILIGAFGKLIDKGFEFSPAIPKLHSWLDKN